MSDLPLQGWFQLDIKEVLICWLLVFNDFRYFTSKHGQASIRDNFIKENQYSDKGKDLLVWPTIPGPEYDTSSSQIFTAKPFQTKF